MSLGTQMGSWDRGGVGDLPAADAAWEGDRARAAMVML